jgi:hypothetical protein
MTRRRTGGIERGGRIVALLCRLCHTALFVIAAVGVPWSRADAAAGPGAERDAAAAVQPVLQPAVEPAPVAPAEPRAEPAPIPVPAAEPPSPPASVEPTDEQQLLALVVELQRYGTLSADEVRRELAAVNQAFTRQRSDANRVRLATLYSLVRTAQDDQRALQLFEAVGRANPGSPAIRQLAAVLQVQVAERVRAVREEQQKADAAVQKLEALRAMERSLLRDRVRSGGGGGGGGGSGN